MTEEETRAVIDRAGEFGVTAKCIPSMGRVEVSGCPYWVFMLAKWMEHRFPAGRGEIAFVTPTFCRMVFAAMVAV